MATTRRTTEEKLSHEDEILKALEWMLVNTEDSRSNKKTVEKIPS